MMSSQYLTKFGVAGLKVLRRGTPHLVNLTTMQQVDPKKMRPCALKRSIENCRYIGAGVVIYFVDDDGVDIATGCELRDYSVLEVGGTLSIGAGSVVGAYNWLQASGSVKIGAGVMIGPHCSIVSTTHVSPNSGEKIAETPLIKGETCIRDNVWIGSHVSVLKGVVVGANSTIGAGSVVNKDIPANSTAYGAPCRVANSE